jgi:hypothetical protein
MRRAPKNITYISALFCIGMAWCGTTLAAEDGLSTATTEVTADVAEQAADESIIPPTLPAPVSQDGIEPAYAFAEHDDDDRLQLAAEWQAVSLLYLDEMRGGFDTGTQLKISFGIERAVYINGNLLTTTNFYIPDVGAITNEQARMLSSVLGTVNLIQNGPGNTFDPGSLSQSAAVTVIQNTLNDQIIKALTTINATANSLELLKDINLHSVLQEALNNSLNSR